MARNFAKPEDWVTFLPSIDGNRDDPDPVSVELCPMSAEEHRRYQRAAMNAKGDAMEKAQTVIENVFRDRVRNVRNYTIGEPIVTGLDLFTRGEQVIVDEVFEALVNMSTLSEGMAGKSSSPSASSPAATASAGGGAAPAADATSKAISPTSSSGACATATTTQAPTSASSGPQACGAAPGPN